MSNEEKTRRLWTKFNSGEITRREFIAKVSILGAAAAITPAILSSPALSSTPMKGGRFRIGVNDFAITDSLDPSLSYTKMQMYLNYQLRNTLVEVRSGGSIYPELAESWEATQDAKSWTFRLRKGVEFHNGKSFEAEDVVFSYQIHTGEKSKSSAKGLVASIKEIKAVDKHTVTFVLKDGNVDWPTITTLGYLVIVPAGTTEFEKGIGTGPYILNKYNPGVRGMVKKNPNYFKEDRGHFDEVETLAISDVTTRTNALVSGEIDAMNFADYKTVHLLEKNNKVKVIRNQGKQHFLYPMRTDTAPYDNPDVRMALKYAIDRESFVKMLLRGYGTVGNDHPLCPAYKSYVPGLPQRQYDPDKAKFHLKKVGMENHIFKIHASDVTFNGAVDGAVLYQEHAKKAGINIEVVKEPADGFWNDVWMKKPWCSSRWSGRPTGNQMISTAYATGASWNESFFSNAQLDKLLKASRVEFDKAKRAEMYMDMQRILNEQGGAVIPAFADFVDAVGENVGFGNLSSEWDLDGCRCSERWWFKS